MGFYFLHLLRCAGFVAGFPPALVSLPYLEKALTSIFLGLAGSPSICPVLRTSFFSSISAWIGSIIFIFVVSNYIRFSSP